MTESVAQRISRRKLEHLELALNGNVEGPDGPGWDDVRLVHDPLPEIDLADVDLRTMLLDVELSLPVWITAMTGGHPRAAMINARLSCAAERHGLAMGVGSQRAAMAEPILAVTYEAARQAAPNAVLIANIGAPQLVDQGGKTAVTVSQLEDMISSIGAQALAIHLNWLQEMMQPEGDRRARGCLEAIEIVTHQLSVPVMVKETGAGIPKERAQDLVRIGVGAIDVGGAGGTSMVRIEGSRAETDNGTYTDLARTFDRWGIPTAVSVLECRDCGVPVIATGGIRSGLDAARALALGAHAVGVGRPFLAAAAESEEALERVVLQFVNELRVALFLTGSRSPSDLRRRGAVILGDLRTWAMDRGLFTWRTA